MPEGLGRSLVPGQDSPSLAHKLLDHNSLCVLVDGIWLEQAVLALGPPPQSGLGLSLSHRTRIPS